MVSATPLPTPGHNGRGAGGLPPDRRLALDNLLRRELRVGDPNNPEQIANALLERYRQNPRTQAIRQEAQGLPFLQATPLPTATPSQTTSTAAEWRQACDDIERDLAGLTTDAILKDVTPELRGWAQAIRNGLQEGYNAARFALDPHQRDKAFAMRRQLNDYARLARLIGSHTPAMISYYRSLAKSLDEAANLLLVLMGESLANIGFGGGRYLPQVPYTEMQVRRDAAVYALRNLVGSTQMAYGPEDWPRGLDAYRQLNDLLEAQGQNDLRSLLVETELARTMDELVQRSSDTSSDGLRAVGSTALLALERFRRLVAVGRRGISPESPALYAFLEALQLFADSFETAGGFRLMKIARPPILFYGLYGNTGMDDADRRLVDMITRRSLLADRIDCMAGACCAMPNQKLGIVLLDKALYDVDRAIDLYALGSDNFGQTERRAAAYGYLIAAIGEIMASPEAKQLIDSDPHLKQNLDRLACDDLRPRLANGTDQRFDETVQRLLDRATQEIALIESNAIADPDGLKIQLQNQRNALQGRHSRGEATVETVTGLYRALNRVESLLLAPAQIGVETDQETEGYLGVLEQELCLQRDMETRWDNLVHSMVPNCGDIDRALNAVIRVIDWALDAMVGETCTLQAPINLPPTLETTFDTLVERVERTGLGRPNRVFAAQRRR